LGGGTKNVKNNERYEVKKKGTLLIQVISLGTCVGLTATPTGNRKQVIKALQKKVVWFIEGDRKTIAIRVLGNPKGTENNLTARGFTGNAGGSKSQMHSEERRKKDPVYQAIAPVEDGVKEQFRKGQEPHTQGEGFGERN